MFYGIISPDPSGILIPSLHVSRYYIHYAFEFLMDQTRGSCLPISRKLFMYYSLPSRAMWRRQELFKTSNHAVRFRKAIRSDFSCIGGMCREAQNREANSNIPTRANRSMQYLMIPGWTQMLLTVEARKQSWTQILLTVEARKQNNCAIRRSGKRSSRSLQYSRTGSSWLHTRKTMFWN